MSVAIDARHGCKRAGGPFPFQQLSPQWPAAGTVLSCIQRAHNPEVSTDAWALACVWALTCKLGQVQSQGSAAGAPDVEGIAGIHGNVQGIRAGHASNASHCRHGYALNQMSWQLVS